MVFNGQIGPKGVGQARMVRFPRPVLRCVLSTAGPLPEEGGLVVRARRRRSTSAWFDLRSGKPVVGSSPTLPARLDVDTLIVDGGAEVIEVRAPHGLPLWYAAWTAEAAPRPFRTLPSPRSLDVPFRSQMAETKVPRNRICLPTCLSMVMAFYGVSRPTAEVAQRNHDDVHKTYGNWARACLTAGSYGFSARVVAADRLGCLLPFLDRGLPIIVSIAFEAGDLLGTPLRRTDGHLVVVRGVTADGDILCNDPAATTPKQGLRTYAGPAFADTWKGVAIVVAPGRRA